MQLVEAKKDSSYVIVGNSETGKERMRLDSLGLVSGEIITVLSNSYAGLIVDIKGSRLAICKSVAEKMEVVNA
ncbi:MAG: ferrous iron transport protein A [Coriobacteriales bacterium]|nr:ferrous iron transport protein A [Coriobacteriales bacterium]